MIETRDLLARLQDVSEPCREERTALDQLCRMVQVVGTVHTAYTTGWKKAKDSELLGPEGLVKLTRTLVSRAAAEDMQTEAGQGYAGKYLNAALVQLDRLEGQEALRRETVEFLSQLGAADPNPTTATDSAAVAKSDSAVDKRAKLCVLYHEGPQARAYLTAMAASGLRAPLIVRLVSKTHPATGAPVGRLVPGGLRRRYAAWVMAQSQLYWPRIIAARHPALIDAIRSALRPHLTDPEPTLRAITGGLDLSAHADLVEDLMVDGLRDPALAERLARPDMPCTIMYTGGGIVPKSLLQLDDRRFIHVHPGHLPHVRGADGLLWSMLIRGRPGMSAFILAPGIDEGDVIAAADLPVLRIELPDGHSPADQTLYRALFSFVDPLLRARFLVTRVLTPEIDPTKLHAAPQDVTVGITYHFLHPEVRRVALGRVFLPARPRRE